ncbi:YtxH domain-containing protein [Alkalihalobacterium alkalinitrilicum]|uniref:YtxH domain-containing protein n=1 Tax=Alkalihalobacterium alkalinitrilicum TaxID=427920 RepID=UPI0009949491|nr:YtxH domain-containing protein [Alkalihalobacterium alkalinitrilicum]
MGDMNTKDFLIGSLIGGIVGASAALLLAPKSGKELRSNINEQALLAKEKTTNLTNTAYERGNEWASLAKEKSTQVVDKVKEVTKNIKTDVEDAQNSADDFVADVADQVAESSDNLKQNLQQEVENINNTITEETEKRKVTAADQR